MQGKVRRRLALMVAGALLAALAVVNVAPVAADDGSAPVETPTQQGPADSGFGVMSLGG